MSVEVPTVEEVATRLDKPLSDEIAGAYAAEVADQAARCRVSDYSAALGEALVRRVQRAMAMRNLPLGVIQDEAGSTRIGTTDPEVRRLEAPYRKVVVG